MARRDPCGRAADIFSLGCVLLEILVIHCCGTLKQIRLNRSKDPCFHANVDRVDGWLQSSLKRASSARENFLNSEIKRMLVANPSEQPVISELLVSFSAAEMAVIQSDGFVSIFGSCCKGVLMSQKQQKSQIEKDGFTNRSQTQTLVPGYFGGLPSQDKRRADRPFVGGKSWRQRPGTSRSWSVVCGTRDVSLIRLRSAQTVAN